MLIERIQKTQRVFKTLLHVMLQVAKHVVQAVAFGKPDIFVVGFPQRSGTFMRFLMHGEIELKVGFEALPTLQK